MVLTAPGGRYRGLHLQDLKAQTDEVSHSASSGAFLPQHRRLESPDAFAIGRTEVHLGRGSSAGHQRADILFGLSCFQAS